MSAVVLGAILFLAGLYLLTITRRESDQDKFIRVFAGVGLIFLGSFLCAAGVVGYAR